MTGANYVGYSLAVSSLLFGIMSFRWFCRIYSRTTASRSAAY